VLRDLVHKVRVGVGRNVDYQYAALQQPKFGGGMPLFVLADFAQRQDRAAVASSHIYSALSRAAHPNIILISSLTQLR
jgi:hypothetical protein